MLKSLMKHVFLTTALMQEKSKGNVTYRVERIVSSEQMSKPTAVDEGLLTTILHHN